MIEKISVHTENLFTFQQTLLAPLLKAFVYPWEVLPHIKSFLLELGPTLSKQDYEEMKEHVWVSKDAVISSRAVIHAPAIIEAGVQIRPGAYMRGSVFVGEQSVVGNSSELKNCILLKKVQVPHYNYVGDSVLGCGAHMGAGAILSNVKSDKSFVTISVGTEKIQTNLKKMGAMLGDFAEIGCNSVLNPGTIVGKHTTIYPLSNVRGVIEPNKIYKTATEIVEKSSNHE